MSPKPWDNAPDMENLEEVTDHIERQEAKLRSAPPNKIPEIQKDIDVAKDFIQAADEQLVEDLTVDKPEAKA